MGIERDQEEIDAIINIAHDTNGNLWGASYEEGVIAALQWATGESDEPPLEEFDG